MQVNNTFNIVKNKNKKLSGLNIVTVCVLLFCAQQ